MRRSRLTAPAAILLAAAVPHPAGRAEVVVQNDTFSTLAIAVVGTDGGEHVIGQAPPEFSNTLYFAAAAAPERIRFRARLQDRREVLHESDEVDVRDRSKVRWSLPDNVVERVRGRRLEGP
ncbi:MAG: hypothetical protein GWM90_24950 [Gemmatimonadetes bacterium]|nr:hypothetical protein [Gemmatimonadota bacterium]NIQ58034.1 hypothetical protein [Gemmatimonadota bacterium]NIU78217.1 hypothetical protein [Gammaproteobacteria bacterium]NIX47206.1 hypothetical protein [Gemmatimonadota bacterium]NIY11582.1 hypothetical protein [Gemmatimonadota bacterium]